MGEDDQDRGEDKRTSCLRLGDPIVVLWHDAGESAEDGWTTYKEFLKNLPVFPVESIGFFLHKVNGWLYMSSNFNKEDDPEDSEIYNIAAIHLESVEKITILTEATDERSETGI